MTKLEENSRKTGLAYQFTKKEIEADHTIYEKGYLHGFNDSSQKAWDFICEHWKDGFFDKNDFFNYMTNS